MEQALRESNIGKRDWFVGWYIGSVFYKATTQAEADTYQREYELRRYFRNRSDYYTETEDEAEDETEDATDDETDHEEEP
jgi:hypothetical protein